MRLNVPLHAISDNPFQKRTDYSDVDELAGRIAAARAGHPDTLGLLQVPVGRLVADDGVPVPVDGLDAGEIDSMLTRGGLQVQLAFGHRRLRAFRHLFERKAHGYTAGVMPVNVLDLDDEQLLDAVWSENYERKDITAVEQAELLQAKLVQLGTSQREVAERWGLGRSTVANRLRLLDAPAGIQDANRAGTLSERQCLALLQVVDVANAVNGTGSVAFTPTGDPRAANNWQPADPRKFLEWITAEERSFTSDDIRDYTRNVAQRAAQNLPTDKAFRDRDPACGSCPRRVNNWCFDADCFNTKKDVFGIALARKEAEKAGVPYSDETGHFDAVVNANLEWKVKDAWEAGDEAIREHAVIGWVPRGYGARPFAGGILLGPGDAEQDSRAGIAIGWNDSVGSLKTALAKAASAKQSDDEEDPEPLHPLEEKRHEWKEAAEAQEKAIRKEVKAALVQRITDDVYSTGTLDMICRLLQGNDFPDGKDFEELAAAAVGTLWEKGSYFSWENNNPHERCLAMADLLERYNFVPEQVAGDFGPEARAVRALAYWSERRQRGWAVEKAAEEIEEPLAWLLATVDDDHPLHDYLVMAMEEVEAVLHPPEAEEPEAVPA